MPESCASRSPPSVADPWSHGIREPFYIPQDDPVTGWRVCVACPPVHDRYQQLYGGLSAEWTEARCDLSRPHTAPAADCECGFRVCRTPTTVHRYLRWKSDAQPHFQSGRAILTRVECFGTAVFNDDAEAERLSGLTPANTLSVQRMRVIGPVFAMNDAVAYGLSRTLGIAVHTVPTFDRAVNRALNT